MNTRTLRKAALYVALGACLGAMTMPVAITVVATVPIICVYPFVQRYFIQGLTLGSVKG